MALDKPAFSLWCTACAACWADVASKQAMAVGLWAPGGMAPGAFPPHNHMPRPTTVGVWLWRHRRASPWGVGGGVVLDGDG